MSPERDVNHAAAASARFFGSGLSVRSVRSVMIRSLAGVALARRFVAHPGVLQENRGQRPEDFVLACDFGNDELEVTAPPVEHLVEQLPRCSAVVGRRSRP